MLRVLFLSLQCAASGGERRAEEDYCACRSPYCGTVPRFSAEPSASAPDEPREPRIARANSARVMVVTFNAGGVARFALSNNTADGFRKAADRHRVSDSKKDTYLSTYCRLYLSIYLCVRVYISFYLLQASGLYSH
jgi:hypothetical protein